MHSKTINLYVIIFSCVYILFFATMSHAEQFTPDDGDLSVYGECTSAILPNVMFLIDTSFSMNTQDVIDGRVGRYRHDVDYAQKCNNCTSSCEKETTDDCWFDCVRSGKEEAECETKCGKICETCKSGCSGAGWERDTLYYSSTGISYPSFLSLNVAGAIWAGCWSNYNGGINKLSDLELLGCADAVEALTLKGYYEGNVSGCGRCSGGADKTLVTGNYMNYIEYAEARQEGLDFGIGDCSASNRATGYRNAYCKDKNYHDYYGTGSGYGRYKTNHIYVDMGGIRPFNLFRGSDGISLSEFACDEHKLDLETNGWVRARAWEGGESSCSAVFTKFLMTGNFLNYLDMKNSRKYNTIDALWDVIESRNTDCKFGIMQFDLGVASFLGKDFDLNKLSVWASHGADLVAPCGASPSFIKSKLFGRFNHANRKNETQYGQPLYFGYDGFISNDTTKDSPLAESLVEAGLYFSGQPSWHNNYTIPETFYTDAGPGVVAKSVSTALYAYRSPIQCFDQENHIIVISDGNPSDDFAFMDSNGKAFSSDDPFKYSYKWIYNRGFSHFDGTTNDIGKSNSTVSYVVPKSELDCGKVLSDNCKENGYVTGTRNEYLDNVSKFLNQNDFSELQDSQKIITHTIRFNVPITSPDFSDKLMEDAATAGGGKTARAANRRVLRNTINSILKGAVIATSFSNAVTPVRKDDMVYSGDHTFLTFFNIKRGERDRGNIKKFKRADNKLYGKDDQLYRAGASTPVKDLWSDTDPTVVGAPKDGVAYVLWKQLNEIDELTKGDSDSIKLLRLIDTTSSKPGRKILTYYDDRLAPLIDFLGEDIGDLKIPIDPALGDGHYSGIDLTTFLVETVYSLGEKWPLGDIIHSNVTVAQYPQAVGGAYRQDYDVKSYLIVGSNDGMLHCFDMDDGKELWAFIPPDMIPRLHKLKDKTTHTWFVDGYISLYSEGKDYKDGSEASSSEESEYIVKKPSVLIFGERRGGSTYHMLNIEDINNPQYIKAIGNDADHWGQSWGRPSMCQIKTGATSTVGDYSAGKSMGFVVPGGYDENHNWDNYAPSFGSDTQGKFINIYTIDGSLHKSISTPISSSITNARIIDHDHDAGRIFSRIYAGDLEGNVYHFSDDIKEVTDDDGNTSWAQKSYNEMDGTWPLQHKLYEGYRYNVNDPDNTGQVVQIAQKIFFPPVAGYSCDGTMLYFGTGNRENPEDKQEENSIFAVKEDNWTGASYDRSDLNVFRMVDLGFSPEQQDLSKYRIDPEEIASDQNNVKGWAINFPDKTDRKGEKVVSDIIAVEDILIFGTYTPRSTAVQGTGGATGNSCKPDPNCKTGFGRIYVVSTCSQTLTVKSYETGTADPMPQPALIFDSKTGKALIAAGDGKLIDPHLPVISSEYWKHSGSAL